MKKNKNGIFVLKSLIIILNLLLFIFLFLPTNTQATANVVTIAPVGPTHTHIADFLDEATKFVWIIIAPLSTIMMLWAAMLFLTSEGDSQKVTKAKNLITYVVVGIVVAIIASGLSLIIKDIIS